MRNVSDNFVEEITTQALCSIMFVFYENLAVYETMWKNMLEPEKP
jgi:hypothetical protein